MQVADLFAKLGLRVDKKSFSAADRLLSGIKTALVGIGAFQGIKFLKRLVTDTIELGDNFATLSDQLGISVTSLQELEFAAIRTDLEFGTLIQGLKILSRNSLEAARGSQEYAKDFKKLGINVKDGNGRLKTTDQLLSDLAGGFSKLKNDTERTALAQRIFGKSGVQLLPLLKRGKAGIEDLRKEARKLGILNPEEVKRLETADELIKDFQFSLRKLKAAIAIGLLPIVEKYLKDLQEWLSNSKNQENLIKKINKVTEIFVKIVDRLVDAFDWMIENWDTLEPILITMVGIWATAKIIAFTSSIWGVVAAFNGLGAAAGFAAAGVALAWHDIAAASKGEWDKAFFAPIHEAASNLLLDLEEFLNPVEDRAEKRRKILRVTDPEEAARRDERDQQRAKAARDMRLGIFKKENFPALYPGSKTETGSTQQNITNTANITVNAPNADSRSVVNEVMKQINNFVREGAAVTGQ